LRSSSAGVPPIGAFAGSSVISCVPSDHPRDELVASEPLDRLPGGHVLAIAQDRDTVAQLHDFFEFVRHEQDGNALIAQLAKHAKEERHLMRRD